MLDDAARRWTDKELGVLEKRMAAEYAHAASDMRVKLEKSLRLFDAEREAREKALDNTREAMEAHQAWLRSQAANQTWMRGMADQLAESAHSANVRAAEAMNGAIPRIYAENANRAAFAVDRAVRADTGFTLVNEEAVRYLMGGGTSGQAIKEVTLTPEAERLRANLQSMRRDIDAAKDIRWNRQKFTSAITQGILQGESIPHIVKRTNDIYGMNRNAAVRAARTATTNAENAGRMASFERAEKLGIDMEIEWQATLDERTRESHRQLDGQRIKLGEYFETEDGPIRWPGDPMADPALVWNCRCRADGRVVGFDGVRGDWADERGERWARLPKDTTYEQWKSGKAVSRDESYQNEWGRISPEWYANGGADGATAPAGERGGIVDGQDITATYEGREEVGDFEIEEVIHAQGFDGRPSVVDAEEFERLASDYGDGGLIMQRAYGAPSQEVLDSYRDALYRGDFYVDCSGGHRYGRGMYASYADDVKPSALMQRQSERYAKAHGAKVGYVETMTLDRSANVITYDELMRRWADESIPKVLREGDDGVLAAALGYDAIKVEGTGEMVVLNRTKLIIRRPE